MLVGRGHYRLSRAGQVIVDRGFTNTITPEGRNAFIQAGFFGASYGTNWCFGLAKAVLTGAPELFSSIGTIQSHEGWELVEVSDPPRMLLGASSFEVPFGSLPEFSSTDEYDYKRAGVTFKVTIPGSVDRVIITNNLDPADDVNPTSLLWCIAKIELPSLVIDDELTLSYQITMERGTSIVIGR